MLLVWGDFWAVYEGMVFSQGDVCMSTISRARGGVYGVILERPVGTTAD